MGKISRIEWLTRDNADGSTTPGGTWNPWIGCTPVTTECANCYAARFLKRMGKDPHEVHATKQMLVPLSWRKPRRVFVCSLSDFFHESVDPTYRVEAWKIIRSTPWLTYIIPTKRPELIREMLPAPGWPECYQHVWLLISAGTNETLARFWPLLAKIPAAVRGISMEPLLERVDLAEVWQPIRYTMPVPDWVIVAGESGPRRRHMDPTWASDIQRTCAEWGIPFYFKGYVGDSHTEENRRLDGLVWHESPPELNRDGPGK